MDVQAQMKALQDKIDAQERARRHEDPRQDKMLEIAPGVMKRLGDCTPDELRAATALVDERVRQGLL